MKINFTFEGLNFEDVRKEQKGEVKPISFSMECEANEMVTLIKEEGAMIQGIMKLAADYIQLEKEKETGRREERRNSNRKRTATEILGDDGELY